MKKGKPSRTAYKVAMNIVTLGTKPGMSEVFPPGLVEATERMLVASGAAGARVVRWAKSPRSLAIYEAFDWMLPGQFEAFAHRKAFCERQVRESIASGATQVLVLGAGYDTLAWRLAPEFPDVQFFEIDHPATARLKLAGVAELGQRDNLILLAENLGERNLVDVLAAHEKWNRQSRTVVLAEGLVMYLPEEAVNELFTRCAAITGRGSRIAFSYIPMGEDGRPEAGRWTGLMLWLLKVNGEPWLWSIHPDAVGSFLSDTGWSMVPPSDGTAVRQGVEFFCGALKDDR
jgi:methyltransferase (TIGR00027 family)